MKNQYILVLALLLILSACSSKPVVPSALVAQALQDFDSQLLQMKADFEKEPANANDKNWVIRKLQFMANIDQVARTFLNVAPSEQLSSAQKKEFQSFLVPRVQKIDQDNTKDLKEILKIYSWLKISEFGKKTDSNAWLIVQHADHDPDFQKQILEVLEKLVAQRETNRQNYAYLFDRVASSFKDPKERKLQKYGTQGQCQGPEWIPFPIEEPEKVDQRRRKVGLPPLKKYIKLMKSFCS